MPRTQQDRSKATQAALMKAARPMFAERGYANVAADEIVAAAGLTRGALHHHFKDKQGLFRAVFEQIETELSDEIDAAIATADDTATRMAISLRTFLDVCERPEVLRIALLDAPTVLGWDTWREIESEHGLKLINRLMTQAASEGVLAHEPSEVLTRFVFSVLVEAVMVIAHADDATAARAQVEQSLGIVLSGLFSAPG
ncbi:TetR/AcrR family transcriptional regulator [Kibdelosporangium phytohabitans]|uniref:TetR family transcriptional regulator n=1 Tax=Kibdelosporangium phytohabitans TaxID=860235 RepID=A0A0N9HS40_9PSEU|nr:TetR/AcrR family transcriptional regulator [Kibdelosporangium phytohabitans]ALG06014.1 TetR family transcriptional regulator [Kibdelosporangium phytohabitans]MBE1465916.1 AcrR family transcriptional regulator [Kibdelosporangium phytohabitans]